MYTYRYIYIYIYNIHVICYTIVISKSVCSMCLFTELNFSVCVNTNYIIIIIISSSRRNISMFTYTSAIAQR